MIVVQMHFLQKSSVANQLWRVCGPGRSIYFLFFSSLLTLYAMQIRVKHEWGQNNLGVYVLWLI